MNIEDLLVMTASSGASDIHLTVGNPPAFRIDGELSVPADLDPMTDEGMAAGLERVLDQGQLDAFKRDLEMDFALDITGAGRFRGNAAMERGHISLVFRHITELALDVDELGLPAVCRDLAVRPRGLVVVTGPTGSGKSTTLAAMIEYINCNTSRRVVSLEDPIEYLFKNQRSVITQREVGSDTHSFAAALGRVLRQNPDVIMVGEMRDPETMSAVLTAAETGHLVFTTAHAPGAPQAVDRIVDMFPPYQQHQVRSQLSAVLEGVLYQRLVPKAKGKGRVAAIEVMLGTYAVRNLIREGKIHQLYGTMQLGSGLGMQTLDQALMRLRRAGVITEEAALANCVSREELKDHTTLPALARA